MKKLISFVGYICLKELMINYQCGMDNWQMFIDQKNNFPWLWRLLKGNGGIPMVSFINGYTQDSPPAPPDYY